MDHRAFSIGAFLIVGVTGPLLAVAPPQKPSGLCFGIGCAVGAPAAAVASSSNPVTTALTGSHATYNIGPGQAYTPDTMPWDILQAGDVVNIFYQSTPYPFKFCLAAQGTQAAPVIVNGVTDANGNRPKFNFNGATTAAACKNVFTGSQYSLEPYGGIVIGPVNNNAYPPSGYKASFITVQNLELYGAAGGNTFVSLPGTASGNTFNDAAGLWIQLGSDITVQNNVIYDNGFGVFTMTKNSSPIEMCERIILRNNRIYGNGTVNSWFDHNVYMQSTNPIVEGNYFGQLRAGAAGSTYKSRSSGEIFRYNYVEASARAVDWVHSEDSNPGIATQADYGTDYAYGNIIINDASLAQGAADNPIHYGGDNCGEQASTNGALAQNIPDSQIAAALSANCGGATVIYRKHLYFYNNTVVNNVAGGSASAFEPSLDGTQIDAWNNIFAFIGAGSYALLESVGQLNLRGNNLIFGNPGYYLDSSHSPVYSSSGPAFNVSVFGTKSVGDPLFVGVGAGNFALQAGSPAIDTAGGIPSGASAATGPSSTMVAAQLPFSPAAGFLQNPPALQPLSRANGTTVRAVHGAATDLGALEAP